MVLGWRICGSRHHGKDLVGIHHRTLLAVRPQLVTTCASKRTRQGVRIVGTHMRQWTVAKTASLHSPLLLLVAHALRDLLEVLMTSAAIGDSRVLNFVVCLVG